LASSREAGRVPELLTVEEAAGVLRIGRGLAYELARRWEATGGAEGLPVIRLGRLLRVPRRRLELLIAGSVEPDPSDRPEQLRLLDVPRET